MTWITSPLGTATIARGTLPPAPGRARGAPYRRLAPRTTRAGGRGAPACRANDAAAPGRCSCAQAAAGSLRRSAPRGGNSRMELSEDGVMFVAERLGGMVAERRAFRVIHEHVVRQPDAEPRRHRAFRVVVLLAKATPEAFLVEDADGAPDGHRYVHAEAVGADELEEPKTVPGDEHSERSTSRPPEGRSPRRTAERCRSWHCSRAARRCRASLRDTPRP